MNKLLRILTVFLILGVVYFLFVHPVGAKDGVQVRAKKDPNEQAEAKYDQKIEVLTPKELKDFLNQRFNCGIGNKFGPFSNVFFVTSRIELGTSIGLVTNDKKIPDMQLEPAFPSTYKPTVKEFLDAIALQTKSRWRYDFDNQVIKSTSKPSEKLPKNIALIDFVPIDKRLGFSMKAAKGWNAIERTNWIMYVPPNNPFAMDLHLLGTVSSDDKTKQAELENSIPLDFALQQFKRVNPKATKEDLVKKKIGEYNAYYFEHQLPPKGEEKVRWRQWHFMVGNRLCYVISTIPKKLDNQLYPDVEQMLKTFTAREILL